MWSMKDWHWQFPKITDKVLNDLLWIEIQVHIVLVICAPPEEAHRGHTVEEKSIDPEIKL